MKMSTICFWVVLICLIPSQFCFAQEQEGTPVTAERLSVSDIEKALLSGAISSKCDVSGFPNASAESLNPDTISIRGIYQNDDKATIYFWGKFKKSIRADEKLVGGEANLIRLNNGVWMDTDTFRILTK